MPGLKVYIGTKIVKAEPMTDCEFKIQKGLPPAKIELNVPGYKVVYEDGYVSWSPKDVFERCYREITDLEKAIVGANG